MCIRISYKCKDCCNRFLLRKEILIGSRCSYIGFGTDNMFRASTRLLSTERFTCRHLTIDDIELNYNSATFVVVFLLLLFFEPFLVILQTDAKFQSDALACHSSRSTVGTEGARTLRRNSSQ